jgi:hypothetical protein
MKVIHFSILIGVHSLEASRPIYENIFGMKFIDFRPPYALAYLNDIEFNIEEDASYRDVAWREVNI